MTKQYIFSMINSNVNVKILTYVLIINKNLLFINVFGFFFCIWFAIEIKYISCKRNLKIIFFL